jgi:hypothetical protein
MHVMLAPTLKTTARSAPTIAPSAAASDNMRARMFRRVIPALPSLRAVSPDQSRAAPL